MADLKMAYLPTYNCFLRSYCKCGIFTVILIDFSMVNVVYIDISTCCLIFMVKTCILIYISFLIVNVGKYTIHGCYGIGKVVAFLIQDIFR